MSKEVDWDNLSDATWSMLHALLQRRQSIEIRSGMLATLETLVMKLERMLARGDVALDRILEVEGRIADQQADLPRYRRELNAEAEQFNATLLSILSQLGFPESGAEG
jgi:hypothetical protein